MRLQNTLVHWFPRVLVILFMLFLSLFALDAFEGENGYWEEFGGFMIHLIPAFMVFLIALIAWKHERTGGILFIALSLVFVLISRLDATTLLLIPGPLILIGILFILDSYLEKRANS